MEKDIDEITGIIVDAAYQLHFRLGPGSLESAYELILEKELQKRGLKAEREKLMSFEYDGILIQNGFRLDLLVEDIVVVELKSLEVLARVHSKQVLTYLKILNLPVGLLINFGAPTLKEGLHRIVNNYQPSPTSPLRINKFPRNTLKTI
jgi:GxxExxY protein